MYYLTYSRKMRCINCGEEENCNEMPIPKLYMKDRTSSLMTSILGNKHVYNSEISQESYKDIKGSGNTKKHGSGGNSYANYLAKKKGISNCNCEISK